MADLMAPPTPPATEVPPTTTAQTCRGGLNLGPRRHRHSADTLTGGRTFDHHVLVGLLSGLG